MKANKLIIYTLLSFSGLIVIFIVFLYLPDLQLLFKKASLKWKSYNQLYYIEIQNPEKIIFLIPDRNLDEFWNHPALQTNTGIFISEVLIKYHYLPVTYRRIDANNQRNQYKSYKELNLQFITILDELENFKNQKYKNSEIIFLAHGDGCNIVLQSLLKINYKINKIILINCGYNESLLDYYGELIFSTMDQIKVEKEIIEKAKKEWEIWKAQKEYEVLSEEKWKEKQKKMVEDQVHPDLIAFRKTISTFQFEHNQNFLKETKNIYFLENLQNLIKQKQVEVYHLISEFDEELPDKYKNFFVNYIYNHYRFILIKNSDHFLFERKKQMNSPVEIAISRKNPFNKLSREFQKILLKILQE